MNFTTNSQTCDCIDYTTEYEIIGENYFSGGEVSLSDYRVTCTRCGLPVREPEPRQDLEPLPF